MIDANSTTAEVEAEYDNTASYFADNDVAKARRFVTACRILIRRLPEEMTKGGNSLRRRISGLEKAVEDAEAYILRFGDSPKGPSFGRTSFINFRRRG